MDGAGPNGGPTFERLTANGEADCFCGAVALVPGRRERDTPAQCRAGLGQSDASRLISLALPRGLEPLFSP